MPETIEYLEDLYHVTITTATDPSVTVDMIVTLGKNAPDLKLDAVGPTPPAPAAIPRSGSASPVLGQVAAHGREVALADQARRSARRRRCRPADGRPR